MRIFDLQKMIIIVEWFVAGWAFVRLLVVNISCGTAGDRSHTT